MDKDIQRQIDEMVTAVGAMCEFLGLMRKNLMEQGFTREEAVAMCTMAMASMVSGGKKNDQETKA